MKRSVLLEGFCFMLLGSAYVGNYVPACTPIRRTEGFKKQKDKE